MHLDFARQLKFGRPLQALLQDFFLDLKLMFIRCVLVVTAATAGEVGACGLGPMRRGFDDGVDLSARKARLLFGNGGLDLLAGQDERHEYRFTASAFVGRKAGQTVATVDQLFYCEEQSYRSPKVFMC